MNVRNVVIIECIVFLTFALCVNVLGGTIYFYRDKAGGLHFTDLPDSRNYKPYISEYSLISKHKIVELAKKYCRELGVDYALVLALLKVESNFKIHAVSRAGAQGLMQIMPMTQTDLKIYSPYDPDENLRGGIEYLKKLLQKYKDKRLAIAAYNAGQGAVDKYGGIPPFKETKRYVKKVLEEYHKFKARLMGQK